MRRAGNRPWSEGGRLPPSRSPREYFSPEEGGAPRLLRAAVAAAVLLLAACAPPLATYRDPSVTIASAAAFDPARYVGRWYEIASFPVPFQAGCTNTVAEYSARPDGTLDIVNSCLVNGTPRRIEGSARPVGPGRLEVSFASVPFVSSPYWVLWVAEDYGSAVVGSPSGRAGWILNREPVMSPDRFEAARQVLDFNGYDISRLVMTPQGAR